MNAHNNTFCSSITAIRMKLAAILGIALIAAPFTGIAQLDCKAEYGECVKSITSMNSCLSSERAVCRDSCYMSAGKRAIECILDECRSDEDWVRRCRDKIKMKEEECRNKQKSCMNNG